MGTKTCAYFAAVTMPSSAGECTEKIPGTGSSIVTKEAFTRVLYAKCCKPGSKPNGVCGFKKLSTTATTTTTTTHTTTTVADTTPKVVTRKPTTPKATAPTPGEGEGMGGTTTTAARTSLRTAGIDAPITTTTATTT